MLGHVSARGLRYDGGMDIQVVRTGSALDAVVPRPERAPPRRVRAAGHDWTIFVESAPLIQAMIDDIRTAQQRVWVEIYIFIDDRLGKLVAEALKERARAG